MLKTLRRTLTAVLLSAPAAVAGDSPFLDIDVYDALARARKQNRIVLIAWVQDDDSACSRMMKTWESAEVAEWLGKYTVPVLVNGPKQRKHAQNWTITEYPTSLFIRPNGRVVRRLKGYLPSDQFLLEAIGAAAGTGEGTGAERPEGESANDPSAWLQYANALFGDDTAPSEALNAYLWCLDHGDTHTPGFLDKHLEFILQRCLALTGKADAKAALAVRRDDYLQALREGFATVQSVRAVQRLSEVLREPGKAVIAYEIVQHFDPPRPELLDVALSGVIKDLVAAERYEDVLAGAGDVLARVRKQVAEVKEDSEATKDDRVAVLMEGANLYETLLAVGRGADADELATVLTDAFPTGRTFAQLINHANRLELAKVADRLGERGLEQVKSPNGIKQIERSLRKREKGVFKRPDLSGFDPNKGKKKKKGGKKDSEGDDGGGDDER